MDWLLRVDWKEAFGLSTSILEIFVRGSTMYLALFFLMRFVLKREQGTLGVTDLLVVVLIADAAQNGMAGDYKSVPDGLLLVTTILFWSWALNWLGFHSSAFQRLLKPKPLPLVRDGRVLRKNMQKELITEEELMTQLRLQGIEGLANVKMACMEGDGRISVICNDSEARGADDKRAI